MQPKHNPICSLKIGIYFHISLAKHNAFTGLKPYIWTNPKKFRIAVIDNEILMAQNFKPELAVFIFATTMNKDSSIEEYVRIKDLESRKKGGFEILLFCWQDISDLIDDHQDTYNFWVGNKQHKTKFDFEVTLDDFQPELIVRPKFVRTIKRYRVREPKVDRLDLRSTGLPGNLDWVNKFPFRNPAYFSIGVSRVNEAICSFKIIMANTGTNVIEDWRITFTVVGEQKKIMDQLGTGPMGMIDLAYLKHKRTYVENNQISYSPKDNEPLIQKDNRYFKAYIIPKCKEYTIPIEWELLARDFSSAGRIFIKVEPEYEDKIDTEYVDTEVDLKDDEILSIEEKKNYNDEE